MKKLSLFLALVIIFGCLAPVCFAEGEKTAVTVSAAADKSVYKSGGDGVTITGSVSPAVPGIAKIKDHQVSVSESGAFSYKIGDSELAAPSTEITVSFTPTDTETYSGGSKTVTVTVTDKTVVAKPAALQGLVYNGAEQTGVPEGEGYTLTGNKAAEPGSYVATASLKEGCIWADGSTTDCSIDWKIMVLVSFNSNGGSAVASQTVDCNSAAVQPPAPGRNYYTFAGWYSDAALTTAYDFAVPVATNITLYAKWTPVYYNIVLQKNASAPNGTLSYTFDNVNWYTVAAGSPVTIPVSVESVVYVKCVPNSGLYTNHSGYSYSWASTQYSNLYYIYGVTNNTTATISFYKTPQTGDSSIWAPLVALLSSGAAGTAAAFKLRKKR